MLLAFQGLCTKGASLCPRASKCHHVLSRDLRCFATMPMEKITFGKDNLPGYVVGDVSNPGVIVIQEWWGVTDIIKAHAEKIANHGYYCLIPDIYHGKLGVDKEEASHLMSNLDWPRAVGELTEAVEYLHERNVSKVGAIGFCMGGALALAAAQHSKIDCCQPCYGTPNTQLAQPENVKVPVFMHVGELDKNKGFSDPETMKDWNDKINAAGGKSDIQVYPACGHAFLNTGEEAVKKRAYMGFPEPPTEQQELAWKTILDFFDKNLK